MKIKYKIILIFILTVILSNESIPQNLWLRQQTPTIAWLRKISFSDSLNGWAAGDSGRIIHTSNGGQNWIIQHSGIDFLIDDLFFLNRRIGWALANNFYFYGSTILKTTNGGLDWNSYRYPDTTLILSVIYFMDSLNGWMGGYNRAILRTTNGGINWYNQEIDSGECSFLPIKEFTHYSSQYAFACGGYFDVAGYVMKTINGGLTWTSSCVAFEPIFDIKFFDSLHIIGAGGDYEFGAHVVSTSDGGITWQYRPLNLLGTGYGVAFRTRAEGWIPLGFTGKWAYTLDSGNTWNEYNQTDTFYVYDVTFTDPYHGWGCGADGTILKYNIEAIGIRNQNRNSPQTNALFQNYPNPFNPYTTIEFYLSKISRVRIIIYDVLGRELKILLNEIRPAGNHKMRFNAESLSSGVYFYNLTASYSETKKFVILR